MRIFLCGGGDGEQTRMGESALDQIVDHTKTALYIPLAWRVIMKVVRNGSKVS